jgi:peptidoglycan hydrolase CwlO-like protein
MKKLILLLVVLVGVWLGVNYLRTGEFALYPSAVSADEQRLQDLEKELQGVDAQIAQAGRSASVAGIAATDEVSALMERKKKLMKEIDEARKRIH